MNLKKMNARRIVAIAMGLATMFITAASQAAIVTQFNFDHGVQPATDEPVYVQGTGEQLSGATYNLTGTAGQFANSPAGGSGQSWFNSNVTAAQGYSTLDHPEVFDSFTLEAMVYLNTVSQGFQEVFNSNGTTGNGRSRLRIDGNVLNFSILAPGTDNLISSPVLTSNTWYHIAAVYDNDANTKSIYINGTLDATAAFVTGSGYKVITGDVMIGTKGLASRNFNGYLDGLVISDTALAPGSFVIPIPEPASIALLGLGGLMMLKRRRACA